MGRLIDADVFKERLMANIGLTNCLDRSFKETPTIDAVEVVRCKNCKYHNTHRCFMAFDMIATDDDGYCYMGERETDHE